MKKRLLVLAAIASIATVHGAGADVVYRETFDNGSTTATAANAAFSTVGWETTRIGATAAEETNLGNASVAGGSGNLGTSIVNGFSANPGRGFFIVPEANFPASTFGITYTLESQLDLDSFDGGEWYTRNGTSIAPRLAVQTEGGNWYVLDVAATTSPASGDGGTNNYLRNVVGGAEDSNALGTSTSWKQITFTPGTALTDPTTLAAATGTVLPSLNITGTGLYMVASAPGFGGATRYDDFTILGTLVPEPASLGVIGIAGLGLLARRRRV